MRARYELERDEQWDGWFARLETEWSRGWGTEKVFFRSTEEEARQAAEEWARERGWELVDVVA